MLLNPANPTVIQGASHPAGSDAGRNWSAIGGLFRNTDSGRSSNLLNPLGLANATVNLLAIDPAQPNILNSSTVAVYPAHPDDGAQTR
jgi:hypothetical protein